MKTAINIWSFPGRTVKESMTLAKEAGYDGIELALNESGELGLDASEAEIAAIKAYADQIGLPIHSLATGLFWSYPFTSDDEAVREKALHIGRKQLETAKALGADAVLIVPGAVGVDFIPGFKPVSYDVAYDRALAAMVKLAVHAEPLGIFIGVENVWNKFLLSPLEMRAFIDAVDSPYVGAYLDVGNIQYIGYPDQWIRILGKRIRKVHVKDFRNNGGGIHGFTDLLAGDVNWAAVTQALQDIGYTQWVTAELGAYRHHPEQLVRNTAATMRTMFG